MTLPGHLHPVPEGACCYNHSDRPATRSVQGETDSMGYETIEFCEECYVKHREEVRNADTSGVCDWCKTHKPALRNRRDFEEGLSGPVYQVCSECITKENEALESEIDQDTYDWD